MTDAEAFLDGLRKQRDRYRAMVAVVDEQKGLLASSDLDALMALVERKRSLMGKIEVAEKDLAVTKERWPELRGDLDAATVRDVEGTVAETRRILQDLLKLEDEGRSLMEKQRDTVAQELKGLMTKKKARGAYGAGGGPEPRFFDKKE